MLVQIWITLAVVCLVAYAQRCSLLCGPGKTCALVRNGLLPPMPDCVSFEEALLLEQALQRGLTPGVGFGDYSGRGFVRGGILPGGTHGGQVFAGAQPGSIVSPLRGPGGSVPNVSVANPGGVGSAVVNDRSRAQERNANVPNNHATHDHSEGAEPPVGTPGLRPHCRPCQSNIDCGGLQCVPSPACGQPSCLFM